MWHIGHGGFMHQRILVRGAALASAAAAVLCPFSANAANTIGDPSNPSSLQSDLDRALGSGAKNVKVTPGKYTLTDQVGGASLAFHDLSDITIDARDVELIVGPGRDALGFNHCRNVIFRGATVHYSSPQTGQAKILAIGDDPSDGPYYDVQIDKGYRLDSDFKSSYLIDPVTRWIKPKSWDMGAKSVKMLDTPSRLRVFWGDRNVLPIKGYPSAVGDYVACRGGGNSMLHADACENCTFQDLTFYWGGVFGIFDTGGGRGNHYIHDTITFGPPPSGATNRPLMSQSADGLHCAGAVKGPDIERCLFEGMGDDGFAIHGYNVEVNKIAQNIVTVDNADQWKAGDPIRLADTVGHYGYTTVTAIEKKGDKQWDITVANAVALETGPNVRARASNPDRNGPGFIIKGNTIRNNRARGMLLKADNGIVEGNTLDGNTMSGISIGPEYGWGAGEADYVTNVIIRDNTIRHTNYATNNQGGNGGIWVHGPEGPNDGAPGNRGITITNNRFDFVEGANIIVAFAAGVTILNNTFNHTNRNQVGDPTVISLSHASKIAVDGNIVKNQGKYGTSLINATDTAVDITGKSDGIRLGAASGTK